MRAANSTTTIHQSLTPEAATVLNHSISDAARRCHAHTTPLHVAAALLASPSGFLRQACIVSHPNSSHPLQCRALDLCFSVALERLPTLSSSDESPPLSNALAAALKRAQAHQRRGCPEQLNQPLLAVKVELEQLVVSVLDDPSVSRVMREAGFSSPAAKSAVENSLIPRNPGRSQFSNPRLHNRQPNSGKQSSRDEHVNRVIEVLSKSRKRNPILVGESEPEPALREVIRKIRTRELGDPLNTAEVVSVDDLGSARLKELGGFVLRKMMGGSGCNLVVDLGDLKWLVDQTHGGGAHHRGGASEEATEAVAEMGKIIARFRGGGDGGRVWVIGSATCETYLRCQVYHPTMESDWDLQTISVVARAPLPTTTTTTTFPRIGTNGIVGSSSESFSPLKTMQSSAWSQRSSTENLDPFGKLMCCPQCMINFEQEVSKLSSGDRLPQWLQNATVHDSGVKSASYSSQIKDNEPMLKRKTEELMKKWNDRCLLLHPMFRPNLTTPLSSTSLYANPNLLARQHCKPKTHLTNRLGDDLCLNINSLGVQPMERVQTPPGSPVKTDLVLGQSKSTQESATIEKMQCHDKPIDADSFKMLLKGLIEKVWWQGNAASAIATTITRCKLGNSGRRGGGARGDIWLLFSGPDRIGKKKMAAALSQLVCGSGPVIISLGLRRDSEESATNYHGTTVLNRIAEAIKRNPFSVIMLQDIDETDTLFRGSIKRAMERGRFTDSYGREISLGNIIFVLTVNKRRHDHLDEEKLEEMVSGGWQLKLSVDNKRVGKRNQTRVVNESVSKKRRETGACRISFDLNEMADGEEDRLEKSHNSSDLTVEHDQEEKGNDTSASGEQFLDSVDGCIRFNPVDFGLIRENVEKSVTARFRAVFGEKMSVRIEREALDRILGGAWLGSNGLDSWAEKVLAPTIHEVRSRLFDLPVASIEGSMVARLEVDEKYSEEEEDQSNNRGNGLPSRINVWVLGEEMRI